LAEETGYRARKIVELVSFFPSPGFLAEKMTIFIATGLKKGEKQPMEDERIQMRWFNRAAIGAAISSGRICDAKTIIGYSLLKLRK
jgi:ADP-ribose pyrophosphatase